MASNNALVLKGHLGTTPQIKTTDGGKRVANIFLITNRRDYKNEAGEWVKRPGQAHNVTVFVPRALDFLEGLEKGAAIEVRASVEQREFTVKATDEVRKVVEIMCNDRFEGHLVKAWNPRADGPKSGD